MLQKEREKNAKIESQKEQTFGKWVWKTLKDIGEWILVSEKSRTKIRKGEDQQGTIEVSQKRYILGPRTLENLLGFEGFEIESTWAKSTVTEVIKDLSKEEWGWVEMKLREARALTFRTPVEWTPKIDPRPDWRIKEIQNQNRMEDTPTRLGEAEAKTKQISAEIGELAGTQETRQPNSQETIAQRSRRTSNESGLDQSYRDRSTN